MKIFFSVIISFLLLASLIQIIASVNQKKISVRNGNNKFYALMKTAKYLYTIGQADSMSIYTKQMIELAQQLKNDSFRVVAYRIHGNHYYLKNDYISAIDYFFKGIKIAEEVPELESQLSGLYNNIGFNYNKLKYYKFALKYLLRADTVTVKIYHWKSNPYVYENLSEIYLGLGYPDSSLAYLKIADNANKGDSDRYIKAACLIDYGQTYAELYKRDSSLSYLRLTKQSFMHAIQMCDSTHDKKHLCNAYIEYGKFLLDNNNPDSALKYANLCKEIATENKYLDYEIKFAGLNYRIFEKKGNTDKAFYYFKLEKNFSDSLANLNQNHQLLNLTFNAQLHENEVMQKQKEEDDRRKRNLQILFVAISIVSGIVLFVLLSRSVIVNEAFIRNVGYVGLLITFEFINLLFHPIIEQLTHHNTWGMLVILVGLACLILKCHHFLEGYVEHQMVDRNIKVRKAFAEKISNEAKYRHEE